MAETEVSTFISADWIRFIKRSQRIHICIMLSELKIRSLNLNETCTTRLFYLFLIIPKRDSNCLLKNSNNVTDLCIYNRKNIDFICRKCYM